MQDCWGFRVVHHGCGAFSLVLLPASPADINIIWPMILCGAGFGLFQSPNNHTIITSAPRERSGGASGMLGTARLLGQSSGAALVALMLNQFGDNGTRLADGCGYSGSDCCLCQWFTYHSATIGA